MASVEAATFVLEHFRPLRDEAGLEIAGRWRGVDPRRLSESVLTLEFDDRVDRVRAKAIENTARAWSAVFPWEGDAEEVVSATLEVGGAFWVELGTRPSARRRLGRPTRPVLPLGTPLPGESGDQSEGESERPSIAAHGALLTAREELAEAQEELAGAQEEIRRAQADAERERARRRTEAARHRKALSDMQSVADEAVRAERDGTAAQRAALEQAEAAAVQAQAMVVAARAELADAREQLEAARTRESHLGVLLSDARGDLERLTGLERRFAQVELEGAAEAQARAEAEQAASQAQADAARAQARVQELEAELESARGAAAEAAAGSERDRDLLARIRAALAEE